MGARSSSRSRSPPKDQFGRILKRRRSLSVERDCKKSSQYRRGQSREKTKRCAKSRSRSCSRSRSSSRSHSRSRERSKDRTSKKRGKISREREESHKRRRDTSPPTRRFEVVEDELARKKRELEELNEMIAYKKSLVDRDPGHRTCIDYDHGRIAIPLAEYKPVRSILKNRLDQPYDDPYYDRPYSPYHDRRYSDRYGDPYTSHPYGDCAYVERPYGDRSYETRLYSDAAHVGPSSASQRYTDRYDVYDEPYYDPAYDDRPHDDLYCSVKKSLSPSGSLPPPQNSQVPAASTQTPLTPPPAVTTSSRPPFRPPPATETPSRSPSPKPKNKTPGQSPPAEKPPLHRFLDMLNKKVDAEKKLEPVYVNDDLLPHERALQDGKGFSRIVGMAQEQPSSSLVQGEGEDNSFKHSSVERTSEESKSKTEPYDKIQSLLRTIGLKLSTEDVSKLANRAKEKTYSPRSSSTERETLSSPREELGTNRTGSLESDHIHSPSLARSSSLEPLSRCKAASEYEEFLDQQELEALKKAQQLQSLTKTMGSIPPTSPSVKLPPGPPPAHYHHPPAPSNFLIRVATQTPPGKSSAAFSMDTPDPLTALQAAHRFAPNAVPGPSPWHPGQTPPGPPPGPPLQHSTGQTPPGPPPGPPPSRLPSQPPFPPSSAHAVLPFISQPHADPPSNSSSPLQPLTTATVTLGPTSEKPSAISTTVARCLKVIETVKSLAVQPPAKTFKTVHFSLPTESSSASSAQSSSGTDDDIKIKQKEKVFSTVV